MASRGSPSVPSKSRNRAPQATIRKMLTFLPLGLLIAVVFFDGKEAEAFRLSPLVPVTSTRGSIYHTSRHSSSLLYSVPPYGEQSKSSSPPDFSTGIDNAQDSSSFHQDADADTDISKAEQAILDSIEANLEDSLSSYEEYMASVTDSDLNLSPEPMDDGSPSFFGGFPPQEETSHAVPVISLGSSSYLASISNAATNSETFHPKTLEDKPADQPQPQEREASPLFSSSYLHSLARPQHTDSLSDSPEGPSHFDESAPTEDSDVYYQLSSPFQNENPPTFASDFESPSPSRDEAAPEPQGFVGESYSENTSLGDVSSTLRSDDTETSSKTTWSFSDPPILDSQKSYLEAIDQIDNDSSSLSGSGFHHFYFDTLTNPSSVLQSRAPAGAQSDYLSSLENFVPYEEASASALVPDYPGDAQDPPPVEAASSTPTTELELQHPQTSAAEAAKNVASVDDEPSYLVSVPGPVPMRPADSAAAGELGIEVPDTASEEGCNDISTVGPELFIPDDNVSSNAKRYLEAVSSARDAADLCLDAAKRALDAAMKVYNSSSSRILEEITSVMKSHDIEAPEQAVRAANFALDAVDSVLHATSIMKGKKISSGQSRGSSTKEDEPPRPDLKANEVQSSESVASHIQIPQGPDSSTLELPRFRVKRTIEIDNLERLCHNFDGGTVTIWVALAKAVAVALQQHPIINSSIELPESKRVLNDHINVAIAVSIAGILMTPTLKQADKRSVTDLSANWNRLMEMAKKGQLSQEDNESGTFVISKLRATEDSRFKESIQAGPCVLSVGKTEETGKEEQGGTSEGAKVKTVSITLDCDHRHTDLTEASLFLKTLDEMMNQNIRALLPSPADRAE